MRGFEVAKGFEDKDVVLPKRSTKNSAGYDFFAIEDTVIPSIWKLIVEDYIAIGVKPDYAGTGETEAQTCFEKKWYAEELKPVLVPTGVKAYMQEDEALFLYNRSSNPLGKGLVLANGVGVVDADYYSNPKNDGHIMFQFLNFGREDVTIKKGEKLGQGIFQKFLKVDNDFATNERVGGFGSTGK